MLNDIKAAGLTYQEHETGAILFASNHGESYDIYAVNPDGTGLTRLTHDNKSSGPIPSPDGTLIAFDSGDVVFLMNADGSDRRPLRGCSREADWAPDSTRLVCSARGGEGLAGLQRWLSGKVPLVKPELPERFGGVTVADAAEAEDPPAAVDAWARSTWAAYAELHPIARRWVETATARGRRRPVQR